MTENLLLKKKIYLIILINSSLLIISTLITRIRLPLLTQSLLSSLFLLVLYIIFYYSIRNNCKQENLILQSNPNAIIKGFFMGIILALLYPILMTLLKVSSNSLILIGSLRILNIFIFLITQIIAFKIYNGFLLEYMIIQSERTKIQEKKIKSEKIIRKQSPKQETIHAEFENYIAARDLQIDQKKQASTIKIPLIISSLWVIPLIGTIYNISSALFLLYYFLMVFTITYLTERNGYKFGLAMTISACLFFLFLA